MTDSLIEFASFCIAQVAYSNTSHSSREHLSSTQESAPTSSTSNSTRHRTLSVTPTDPESMEQLVSYVIRRLHKYAQLRTTELLQALSLIDRMSKSHWATGVFVLSADNIFLCVLSCLMLAHKFSTDKPYSNGWFAKCFGLSLTLLNETESTVFSLLHFSVAVDPIVYSRYYDALVIGSQKRAERSSAASHSTSTSTSNSISGDGKTDQSSNDTS